MLQSARSSTRARLPLAAARPRLTPGNAVSRRAAPAAVPAAAPAAPVAPAVAPTPEEVARTAFAAFETSLQKFMADRAVPGVQIAFSNADGFEISKAYGKADVAVGNDLAETTLCRVASVTKLFTDVALGQLVRDGKLSWDDKVADILPWFKPRSADLADPDAYKRVTVQQLITHTSGLQRDGFKNHVVWSKPERVQPTRAELVAEGSEWTLYKTTPADPLKYSNLALAIAGEIVAAKSGRSYQQYVMENVVRPLGLKHTKYNYKPTDDVATMYFPQVDGAPREATTTIMKPNAMAAPAGLASTAKDLTKFMRWMGNSNEADPVLPASMRQSIRKIAFQSPRDFGLAVGGMGPLWYQMGTTQLVGHTGTHVGSRTLAMMTKDGKAQIGLTANAPDLDARALLDMAGPVLAALSKMVAPKPAPAAAAPKDPAWAAYIGKYMLRPLGDIVIGTDAQGNLTAGGRRLVPTDKPNAFLDPDGGFTAFPGPGQTINFVVKDGGMRIVNVGHESDIKR